MKIFIKIRYYLNAFFFILPFNVYAAEEAATSTKATQTLQADPINSGYMLQLVVGLFVVLLCILVLAWLAKKMNRFQSVADGSLKVIAGLSMGSREKVALLQVGDEQLLIGISPGHISKLHVLKTPIEINSNEQGSANGKNFLEKLNTMMANADASSKKQNKP